MKIYQLHMGRRRPSSLPNRVNNARKAMDVLSGLSLGIIADGVTNSKEAEFLRKWIESNLRQLPVVVTSKLLPILDRLSSSEEASDVELENLTDILEAVAGVENSNLDSTLDPNSNPACDLVFDTLKMKRLNLRDSHVVISGKFSVGTEQEVFQLIEDQGGHPSKNLPSRKTSFLIVGAKGSADYLSKGIGTKISKAIELRSAGSPILILREADFLGALSLVEGCPEGPAEADSGDLPLAGKTFVLTGSLSVGRPEMKRLLEAGGAKVSGSISKNTDYLLAGEGGGSKRDKAEKLGVAIIDEATARGMLGKS